MILNEFHLIVYYLMFLLSSIRSESKHFTSHDMGRAHDSSNIFANRHFLINALVLLSRTHFPYLIDFGLKTESSKGQQFLLAAAISSLGNEMIVLIDRRFDKHWIISSCVEFKESLWLFV